ncbi:pyridoxal phosphate-dependent aminotransferase, partial [Escherichia coli]|nr:pyridoxal phosphate-dependent aminotransferase [Escherichia coli]
MQKFSNMSLSEVASAAAPATMPAAGRVAEPTADPASLSAELPNLPRSGIRDVFD